MPITLSLAEKLQSSKMDLLDKIWMSVKPEDKLNNIVVNIINLTQSSLCPGASTLILKRENDEYELYFQHALGLEAKHLKRLHIGRQSGIVTWVIKNGKTVLVNNPEKNRGLYRLLDDATSFRTKYALAAPIIIHGKTIGVIEALNNTNGKPFNKHDVDAIVDVATAAALSLEGYSRENFLMLSYKHTVSALVSLADAKESSGGGHSRRLVEYALMGARELGLSKQALQSIEYAALLHDIGKLSIPDEILNKPTKLNEQEWVLIKKHPLVGYEIIKDVPFLKEASQLVLCHHERYDGAGYPRGLHGENIPLGARLISVVDAFDNMTTNHSYRSAMRPQEAFAELFRCSGDQFCPKAVKAFNTGYVRTRLTQSQRP
jgi:HD-GYP domain-containing protein (c-di-GMP phosphodiesterase class II)